MEELENALFILLSEPADSKLILFDEFEILFETENVLELGAEITPGLLLEALTYRIHNEEDKN